MSVCVVFREPELPENHLKDLLQQLVGLIAAKPSEKAVVCQGDGTLTPFHCVFLSISTLTLFFSRSRRGRGSRLYSHLLDQQMGRLL